MEGANSAKLNQHIPENGIDTDLKILRDPSSTDIKELEPLVLDGISNHNFGKFKDETCNKSKCSGLFAEFVVVFGAFWSCFFSLGIAFSIGTFLPAWLEEFKEGRAETALIQSVHVGVLFGAGTIVGVISDRFGLMLTVMVGSVLACIGFLGVVFASSVAVLIVTIGVISGFGFCCVFLSSMVVVSTVCSKSVSIALGFIIAGGGMGQSILPYLCDRLHKYYGWRGSFFIIAGVALQPTMFGYLMTTVAKQIQRKKSWKASAEPKESLSIKLKHVCCPRYILTCITSALSFAAANGFFFIVVDFANIRQGNGVFFIFLITTISTVCNVIVGIINRHPLVSSSVLFGFAVLLLGADLLSLTFVEEYVPTAILIAVFGVAYGCITAISGVVILDIVGQKAYSLGIGINITINGVTSSVGGIVFGLLYDLTRSYGTPLISMGTVSCIVGTLPLIGLILSKRQQNLDSI